MAEALSPEDLERIERDVRDSDVTQADAERLFAEVRRLRAQVEHCSTPCDALKLADSYNAALQEIARLVGANAGPIEAAAVNGVKAMVERAEKAEAEVRRLRELGHPAETGSRICSKPGCDAAIVRADDGSRTCAAGHPLRWVAIDSPQDVLAQLQRCDGACAEAKRKLTSSVDGGAYERAKRMVELRSERDGGEHG